MRHSTQEEKDDYEAMLKRKSTVLVTASEEFEQLESENASLRGAVQGLGRLCDQYKAENNRLRELAKAAWGCVNRHVSCDACRMTCGGCTLQSAMRDLEIEVKDES